MNRKAITERLRALASDDKKRSKAARLRDVIDDVEAALAAGVPRSVVVEELGKQGLEMTLASFDGTLKRIRQKREKPSNTSVSSRIKEQVAKNRPKETAPVVESDIEQTAPNTGSHNPAELDKIIGSKPDLAALAKFGKKAKS